MKYNVTHIDLTGKAEWEKDLLQQEMADMGFDSFIENEGMLDAYIPEQLVTDDIRAAYTLEDCPDENWNATWEAEHPIEELPMGVKIIPHCAFGAGYHETTGMMIDALISSGALHTQSVLDMGCGTGVLGIMALYCGAKHATFVDIDTNSVANTIENLALNGYGIDDKNNTVLNSDSVPQGQFDLILANIHRNILLEMMSDFADRLNDGGEVWMSGFYEDDIAALRSSAKQVGLQVIAVHPRGEWRMIKARKC